MAMVVGVAVPVAQATEFPPLEPGEEILWVDPLTTPAGWVLDRAVLAEGTLRSQADERWTEGRRPLTPPAEITATPLRYTWALRTDRAAGEDRGALYFKLFFTDDPARREQLSLNFTTRASSAWYMFYVDPGWQLPNAHYTSLTPPAGQFPDPATVEFFRITLWREGPEIVARAETWHRAVGAWVRMAERGAPTVFPELRLAITPLLEGQTAVRAVDVQLPHPVPVFTGLRATRLPVAPATAFFQWQERHFSSAERLVPDLSGPAADPDRDAVSNLFEYALGRAPRLAEAEPAAIVTLAPPTAGGTVGAAGPASARHLTLVVRRPHPGPAGVTLRAEASTELAGWSSAAAGLPLVAQVSDGLSEWLTWRAVPDVVQAPRLFGRVVAERIAPAP